MMMMFTFMVVGLFITFSRLGSLFPLNENAQNAVGFFLQSGLYLSGLLVGMSLPRAGHVMPLHKDVHTRRMMPSSKKFSV